MTLKMNTRGPTQFAIVSVFKKETFAISTDEAKIVPASEPDAEIDIPKGAFEKAAELQLNVSYLRARDFFVLTWFLKIIFFKLSKNERNFEFCNICPKRCLKIRFKNVKAV